MSFVEQRALCLAALSWPCMLSLVCMASVSMSCTTPEASPSSPQNNVSGQQAPDSVEYQERAVPYESFDSAGRAVSGFAEQAAKEVSGFAHGPRPARTPSDRSAGSLISDLVRAGQFRAALEKLEPVLAATEPGKDVPFTELAVLVLRLSLQRSDPVDLLAASRRVEDLLASSRQTLPLRDRVLFGYFVEVTSALVAVQAGERKQARKHLVNARALQPEREEHCLLSAQLWVDEREWGAAEAMLDNCHAHLSENSAEFYALLVFVKQARGKSTAGSVVLRRALELYPDHPLLTVMAAKNEFDRGDRVHSCQQFESLYRSGRGGSVGAHYAAICALGRSDTRMSKDVLENAHLRFGATGPSSQMLFGLYALEGRAKAALEAVRTGSDTLSSRESSDFQSFAALLVERLETLSGALPNDPAGSPDGGDAWVKD